jgi:hypothetical protein
VEDLMARSPYRRDSSAAASAIEASGDPEGQPRQTLRGANFQKPRNFESLQVRLGKVVDNSQRDLKNTAALNVGLPAFPPA